GQGVLVVGQSSFKEFNRSFRATTAGPLQMPLMILIDGGTASAAEVLAGALQNNRPATRLIGQLSLGKGSIQVILPMERLPGDSKAGVRITVARLFSPGNHPYTLRGVTPDVLTHEKGEALLHKAQSQLLGMIKNGMPMNPMSPAPGSTPAPVESRSEMIPDEMGPIPANP
ncbi:MAG: S41 family peptidase, partial [Gemmataceae bacterium]